MERRRGVVLCGVLSGSEEFGLTQPLQRYTHVLRAFQAAIRDAVESYREARGWDPQRPLVTARADECCLVLLGGRPGEDEGNALAVAVAIASAWALTDTAQELAAFGRHPYGTGVHLTRAIACGEVVLDSDPWGKATVPAGAAVEDASRLARMAATLAPGSGFVVALEVLEAARTAGMDIAFGARLQLPARGVVAGRSPAYYPVTEASDLSGASESLESDTPAQAYAVRPYAIHEFEAAGPAGEGIPAEPAAPPCPGRAEARTTNGEVETLAPEAVPPPHAAGLTGAAIGLPPLGTEPAPPAVQGAVAPQGSAEPPGAQLEARCSEARRLEASGDPALAEALWRSIVTADQHCHEGWFALGRLAEAAGRQEEAMRCYHLACDAEPEAWYRLGNIHDERGERAEAVRCFQAAVAAMPQLHDAWLNLGLLLEEDGAHQQAAERYRQALQVRPDWPEAWNNLGNTLRSGGDLDGAIQSYREAVRLQPDCWDAWFNLGGALLQSGSPDEATDCFVQTLTGLPGFAPAWYNLALTRRALGDVPAAIECFQETLNVEPEHAGAWHGLGVAYAATGEGDQALSALQRASELAPEDQGTGYDLACAYGLAGLADQALGHLERLVALDPSWRDKARRDPDLQSLRALPSFQALVNEPLPN